MDRWLENVTDITYLQYLQEEEKELTALPDSGEAKPTEFSIRICAC